MSKAFYHEGLTIESDVSLPELRIEGRVVKIKKEGELFVYLDRSEVSAETLDKLGPKIIDSWREIKDNRVDIKEKHLEILKEGVKHWNQWRKDNPEIRPILYRANLIGKDLSSEEPVDFSNANLIEAKLNHAILVGANFHEANLGHADL
ncbi:MAG: pentapeptide repeat-containing protein [Bacteroidota bacterium]|nr:pentapeptide repeat-containing protein [Bacteroidota bacterium]